MARLNVQPRRASITHRERALPARGVRRRYRADGCLVAEAESKEEGPVRRVKRRLSQHDLRTLGVRPGLVATRYTPDTEENLEERETA